MNRHEFENEATGERRLRLGLESLREAYSQEQASSSTEEQLLSKFRSMNSSGRLRWSWRHWGLAAAAALLLTCGLGLWLASRDTPPPQPRQQASAQPLRAKSVTAEGRSDRIVGPPAQAATPVKLRRVRKAINPVATRSARHAPGSENSDAGAFIPTMFPTGTDADYGLQLVRVELPGRTMMSFGLPVDSRELNRPVKADLIIGPDGLTRAIRFVR